METTKNILAGEKNGPSKGKDLERPVLKRALDKVCETPVLKESQLCEDEAQIP